MLIRNFGEHPSVEECCDVLVCGFRFEWGIPLTYVRIRDCEEVANFISFSQGSTRRK